MASGSGLKQTEDSPDEQTHNLARSHQWEAEGDILNPMTRATSRCQPPSCPRNGVGRHDSIGNAVGKFMDLDDHASVQDTAPS